MLVYMVLGGVMFSAIEGFHEMSLKDYTKTYALKFLGKLESEVQIVFFNWVPLLQVYSHFYLPRQWTKVWTYMLKIISYSRAR